MWPFRKKNLKIYKIKWECLNYYGVNSGTDVVEATSLAKAWKKVCKMHEVFHIGMTSWEILEEKND